MSLPTALAPILTFVHPECALEVETSYEAALLREVDRIVETIPPGELSLQWDICQEVWLWEGWTSSPFDRVRAGITERWVRASTRVPEPVELGYHLCYGDYKQRFLREPADCRKLVEMANWLAAKLPRRTDWYHIPVPRDRFDNAYFAPLADLRLPPQAEIYLGLLQVDDSVEVNRRRIAAAQRVLPEFGIAAECGFGRDDAGTLSRTLDLHAQLSSPLM